MDRILLFLFILVLSHGHQALADRIAADPIEAFFQSLNSPHLEVKSRKQTQSVISKTSTLKQFGLTWSPDLPLHRRRQHCDLSTYRIALASDPNPQAVIKKYWQACEPEWRDSTFNTWTDSQSILRMNFEPSQHPAVRIVKWNLKNNIKAPGYLFMKGPEKRPLVILRPGIFSSLESTVAERFLMMQLFEEGPNHLLVLPSTSGSSYIELNHLFSFGGFEEGLQTWQILELLHDSKQPLSAYVSKIHLAGVSLGGHGIWLTNLLQQLNKTKLVESTLLLCPAVDLRAIQNFHQHNPLARYFFDLWFERRLSPNSHHLGLKKDERIADFLAKHFNEPHHPQSPWPSVAISLPPDGQNSWYWNDFWSWLPTYDFKDTFVIWTHLDPIIPPSSNADLLSKKYGAPDLALLELPRGLHCSLPTTYQWAPLSLTMRAALDSDGLANPNAPETPPSQFTFHGLAEIKNLRIKAVELSPQGDQFYLTFVIEFTNFLLPPKKLSLKLPTTISQQQWVLSNFNEHLRESLIRELSSRTDWEQSKEELKIRFNP